jgi:hypothetical protein
MSFKNYTLVDSKGNKDNLENIQKGGGLNIVSPLIPTHLMSHYMNNQPVNEFKLAHNLTEFTPSSVMAQSTPLPPGPLVMGPLLTTPFIRKHSMRHMIPPLMPSPLGFPLPVPMAPIGKFNPIIPNPNLMVRYPHMNKSPFIPFAPLIIANPEPSTFASGIIIINGEEIILCRTFDNNTLIPAPIPFFVQSTQRTYKNKVDIFGRTYRQSGIYDSVNNANEALKFITEGKIINSDNMPNKKSVKFMGYPVDVYFLEKQVDQTITHNSIVRFKKSDLKTCLEKPNITSCNDITGIAYSLSSKLIDVLKQYFNPPAAPAPAPAPAAPAPAAPAPAPAAPPALSASASGSADAKKSSS